LARALAPGLFQGKEKTQEAAERVICPAGRLKKLTAQIAQSENTLTSLRLHDIHPEFPVLCRQGSAEESVTFPCPWTIRKGANDERRVCMVREVSTDNFAEEVVSSSHPVMVDFWGPQCKPCLALMPYIEELNKRYPGIKIVKVDASKNRRLCLNLKVLSLPTYLFYRGGKEVARLAGEVTRERLTEEIETLLRSGE
jgi:thioredoxin 1